MKIAMHDNEVGNSLVTPPKYVSSDLEAEEYVKGMAVDVRAARVIKWILFDFRGIICVWERSVGASGIPKITKRSSRFTGKWGKGPDEVVIP